MVQSNFEVEETADRMEKSIKVWLISLGMFTVVTEFIDRALINITLNLPLPQTRVKRGKPEKSLGIPAA